MKRKCFWLWIVFNNGILMSVSDERKSHSVASETYMNKFLNIETSVIYLYIFYVSWIAFSFAVFSKIYYVISNYKVYYVISIHGGLFSKFSTLSPPEKIKARRPR